MIQLRGLPDQIQRCEQSHAGAVDARAIRAVAALQSGRTLQLCTRSPMDYPQRWPRSLRVNSSGSDADDATLIEKIEVA
jgi:hypothetical protein